MLIYYSPIEITYHGCEWRSESKVASRKGMTGLKRNVVRLYRTTEAWFGSGTEHSHTQRLQTCGFAKP